MKQLIILAFTAFVWLANTAYAEKLSPLIDPQKLSEIVASSLPLIIDIRGKDKEGKSLFEAGHIAGSVNAPYGLFRGSKENPGKLISKDHLQNVLRKIGAEKKRPTVVSYQGANISDFGAAARVYWTLKSAGFDNLSILNGGVNNWKEAGLSLETGSVTPTPSNIEVTFSDNWLATTDDVLKVVEGDAKARLVDARPEEFWKGEKKHPAAARPGTLPQSSYFVHSSWFDGKSVIVNSVKAKELAQSKGFTSGEPLVSFCNTGHWAATNWFALSELAELDNVKLYPESLVGYSNAGHEMANTPGLIETLIKQITGS